MTREGWWRIAFGAAAVAAAIWFVGATEWVEIDEPEPARNEAARNPSYATQSMLRLLGAKVVQGTSLEQLPPAHARLVLQSRHWDLFPDRAVRLRRWVEQGGHLVVPGVLLDQKGLAWLPVRRAKLPDDDDDDEDAPPKRARPARGQGDCRELSVPAALAPTYPDKRSLNVCGRVGYPAHQPVAGVAPTWALDGANGAEMFRVPFGKGSVTVLDAHDLMDNRNALRGETALAIAAALQVQRAAEVWFVTEERREPILAWLWEQAWPATLLALGALLLWAWRGAVRFTPLPAPVAIHRRSMREQINGTAHFLLRDGQAALHAAQARALHDTAARQIAHYRRLGASQQLRAIATHTGVDGDILAGAIDAKARRTSGRLGADLEFLEHARRLLALPAQARPASPRAPSTIPLP